MLNGVSKFDECGAELIPCLLANQTGLIVLVRMAGAEKLFANFLRVKMEKPLQNDRVRFVQIRSY